MGKPKIDEEICTGCGVCIDECSSSCLELIDDKCVLMKPNDCTECGNCENACSVEA